MDDILNLIGNLGFPIAITVYLLVRFEKKIDQLNDTIYNLNLLIKEYINQK